MLGFFRVDAIFLLAVGFFSRKGGGIFKFNTYMWYLKPVNVPRRKQRRRLKLSFVDVFAEVKTMGIV